MKHFYFAAAAAMAALVHAHHPVDGLFDYVSTLGSLYGIDAAIWGDDRDDH
jgi:hypothetical protein